MKNETIRNQNVQRDATLMCDRLSELCSGSPENEFDKWLRERFYPIVAVFTRSNKFPK